MAATIVHEARVDGITAVAITSITPLADTLALQEGDISVLQTYQSIFTWKCGVVSLVEHHPLSQHTSCLVTQAH